MTYANGDTYVGTYVEGKKASDGVFVKKNGETYFGEWLDDMWHGQGKWTAADGNDYFIGSFVEGVKTVG